MGNCNLQLWFCKGIFGIKLIFNLFVLILVMVCFELIF